MATHAEVQDLIRIGAYTRGTSPQIDKVIELMPTVNSFLQQGLHESFSLAETCTAMKNIAAAWPY